ncbi:MULTISPECIES: PilT/PilU family type 4a pilus ATPase [unclassified Undibacterium]|uniref:PilT/PilU family type 4a pilus ATPase n=1 Tax=unclassified Undibacterium TaxID=2630295 RepID=UPI002AC97B70|nr:MULTISPECIES: PilT/PilU family type 4a pilus ATPase [unclassified Undibacterium]MEB0137948.1 PilT/PilU family type 4a pilus ATPase [Undibacterium sp. CCC2.1]MEB0172068.1 PilT/PilU family type 4a pilus ATPase [Undibacterium sp. CCC1.1]MEB0174956.1 PilT/PilU family type 4a pilus ATPase [Undibacterium sp. CCC3.4]MEB0214836.1 PilT/PilU family type 4a pilus ATPase [Undibacterium sp. 5I2]WPX45400.1 PilT/PilU family type 4a pilus ATPase [Undibacterium sp. CCC3.4]
MERDQATKFMNDLLRLMLSKNGSDLFITAEFPPAFKIDGRVTPVSNQPLTAAHTVDLARAIMNDKQASEFESSKECNFAINPAGMGRFRVSAFMQQGRVGLVLRTITTAIPKLADLGLPEQLKEVSLTKRGLVIMVGATGSGKSTTLAAMLGYRNENSYGHIITIEDPIEYVHPHGNCIVTQREVGIDTADWGSALKNSLRQAPDVIQIGEIRDRETMDFAVAFAETGHLCLATLHANSSNQALDRIINFFPEERRAQLLMDLSLNLKAVISQRLIPVKGRKGRIAAVEVLLNTPLISDMIFKGQVHEMKEIMKKSRELGMQTFDQALFDLHEADKITYEDALRNADSVNELRLAIMLQGKDSKDRDLSAGTHHLGIL